MCGDDDWINSVINLERKSSWQRLRFRQQRPPWLASRPLGELPNNAATMPVRTPHAGKQDQWRTLVYAYPESRDLVDISRGE